MAIRINKQHKTIMDKMPDVIRSEYKFRNLILAGVMAGMLSVTEPKGKQKKHPHHFHNRPVKWAEHGDIGYEQYWNLDRTNGLFVPLYLPVQPLQVVRRPHVQAHRGNQYHRRP